MLFALAEALSQTQWLHFAEQQEQLGDISVYDEASRGPWGSLQFLRMGLRFKPSMIACVGALITLLVQAMGPATQQIVVFDTQSVQQSGVNASLLVLKTYSSHYNVDDTNYIGFNSPTSIAFQRAEKHAILDGLSNANVPIRFICQSGYFSTLSLCNSCTDVSNMTDIPVVESTETYDFYLLNVSFITPSGFLF